MKAKPTLLKWLIIVFLQQVVLCPTVIGNITFNDNEAKYGGGDGTAENPYLIYTPEQMNEIGLHENDWNKHFRLMADIDLSQYTGMQFNIIGCNKPFRGVFDGNGHAISNFTYSPVDSSVTRNIGLFGYVYGHDTQIMNLRLIHPVIHAETKEDVGSLIGRFHSGTVTACSVEDGSVRGDENVGGLVGISIGKITKCFSSGTVSGKNVTGGLVGSNLGLILYCYSTGTVTGDNSIGGLAGSGHNGSVACSYSTLLVQGKSNTGGLIGGTRSTAYLSYWDVQTSGITTSTAGDGLTTEQLMNADTFRGWGCDDVWSIDHGISYPHLTWEGKPGQPIMDESRTYGGGTGIIQNPYQIWTEEQFASLHWYLKDFSKHFVLMADLDLDLVDPNRYGPIGIFKLPFTGTFDGKDHTISNWTNHRQENFIGVFGFISQLDPNLPLSSGLVKNLHITNFTATGSYHAGGIAGFNAGTITSCTVSADVTADRYVGGLVGVNQGHIESCRSSGQLAGQKEIGGAVGYNKGNIISCYTDTSVTGNSYVGGLVGNNWHVVPIGIIQSCHSNVNVLGHDYVGGLIGYDSCGMTISCSSRGIVTGIESVGGLIGQSYNGTATICYSEATISGSGHGIGGLIGWNEGGVIQQCFSKGHVEGPLAVGGLVGRNFEDGYWVGWNERCYIEFCYAQGDVTGSDKVGGLVGENKRGTLFNCYSTGQVTGNEHIGGLVGYHGKGPVRLCYWDMETSQLSYSAAGEGKTTEQLMSMDTFLGWGDGVWRIEENQDYPRLAWEQTPGQLIGEEEPRYGGGTGEPNDPYQIWTEDHLVHIAYHTEDYGKHFALMADLDMAVIDPNIILPIGMYLIPFIGIFEGNSHMISNFVYENENEDYVGLFGYVGPMFSELKEDEAVIRNLHMVHSNIHGRNSVGGIAGHCRGTIISCSVDGLIQGKTSVGGIVGDNYSFIERCRTTTNMIGKQQVGGLAGVNYNDIQECTCSGQVSGDTYVGGLAGLSEGWIKSCYSHSPVAGDSTIGGLVGKQANKGGIVRSYSKGLVTGNSTIGGLLGVGPTRSVFMSFWDIESSGVTLSAGGIGKTTAQMYAAETYIDWGISENWTIREGLDYPHLAWENAPGTLIVGQPYTYGGGSGLEADPYQIWTAEQFVSITDHYEDFDKCFILMTDIDLNDVSPQRIRPIGTYSLPFMGVFDGNDHTINNFHFETTNENWVGLFGCLGGFQSDGSVLGGIIKNLHLTNMTIAGDNYTGGLAGSCYGGILTSCNVSGSVAGGSDVGGLVGFGWGANISSSYTSGIINGYRDVGGLVGFQQSGQITQSSSTCEITGHEMIGGLVGKHRPYLEESYLSQCAANGSVRGHHILGGLVGNNGAVITNCYATGDVIGEEYTVPGGIIGPRIISSSQVGGLAGANDGQIMFSYSGSYVEGHQEVGGFVGIQKRGESLNCFWDVETSGQLTSIGGTGKTTAEMQTASTFFDAGWDFVGETANGTEDIWWILEGQDYPRLWWEQIPEN